ncbi:hypothetical protein [Streptomyces cyaneofuscatus]|uniref:hypothetical protein n=1 Tax=Streptomyces cyaneofuscatus TaxID=66883 RepID=UPI0036644599
MRPLPPLAVAAALLLTGCVSVHPGPDTAPPAHRPAGHTKPLPLTPAPPASPPAQPHGLEELAWMGPPPAASATADSRRRPTKSAAPPARTAPPRRHTDPTHPRKPTPATPRNTKRWVPTPRVPAGGGMASVCRSAQGVVSPGLAGLCRSVGR